jgi:hypothetical protein
MPLIKSAAFEHSIYIYYDSKFLAIVVCFAELVQTDLLAIWTDQHAPYVHSTSDQPELKSS